ncbi:hypothetical protein FQN57_003596 [Myotisia sp. PD_48]|nr:hypothetical protein FQN57_003596 [Myotisia sp. PD_48]
MPPSRPTIISSRPSRQSVVIQQSANRTKPRKVSIWSSKAPSTVPALSEPSTASTPRTISFEEMDQKMLNYQPRLEELFTLGENASFQSEPRTIPGIQTIGPLRCLLDMMFDCEHLFDSVDEWKVHVTDHFKPYALPEKVKCLICKQPFVDAQPPDGLAWRNMLDHILAEHPPWQQADDMFPDFDLLQDMYCKGIISMQQFRLLQIKYPAPYLKDVLADQPFCMVTNPSRERRQKQSRVPAP